MDKKKKKIPVILLAMKNLSYEILDPLTNICYLTSGSLLNLILYTV